MAGGAGYLLGVQQWDRQSHHLYRPHVRFQPGLCNLQIRRFQHQDGGRWQWPDDDVQLGNPHANQIQSHADGFTLVSASVELIRGSCFSFIGSPGPMSWVCADDGGAVPFRYMRLRAKGKVDP